MKAKFAINPRIFARHSFFDVDLREKDPAKPTIISWFSRFSDKHSLRTNLENFSLTTVLEEIGHWMKEGTSLFAKQWQAMQDTEAATANTG